MSSNPATENTKSIFRAADIVLDSAYQGIDAKGWQSLFSQARSAHVEQFIQDLFAGKHVNASEDRPALHSALRNLDQKPVLRSEEHTSELQSH